MIEQVLDVRGFGSQQLDFVSLDVVSCIIRWGLVDRLDLTFIGSLRFEMFNHSRLIFQFLIVHCEAVLCLVIIMF